MADQSISLIPLKDATAAFLDTGRGLLGAVTGSNAIRMRLLHGLAWTTMGSVVAQGGSFLTAVILARILGREIFGRFAVVQSTAVALTSVASLGLGVTATKYVSELRLIDPDRVGRILGLCSAVAIVAALSFSMAMVVLAPAMTPGGEPSVVAGLRVCAVYVFFITLNGYQMGAMAGFEEFRTMAAIHITYGIGSLILSWGLARWSGLTGAVLAQPVGVVLLWGLYHRQLSRKCRASGIRIRYREAWRERGVLFRFSIPSATCGMLMTAAAWWCNIDLARVSGYTELALFSAVNNLRSMVLFVPGLISRVSCPCLTRLLAGCEIEAYRRTFRDTVLTNGGIAVSLAVFLSLAGGRILRLFGRDFVGSPTLFVLFLGSVVFEVLATTLFQALFTAGRIWHNVAIVTAWVSVLLGCAWASASRFGASGIALAYLCAWGVSLVLYAVAARRQLSSLEERR